MSRAIVLLVAAGIAAQAQECAGAPDFPAEGSATIQISNTKSWKFNGAAGENIILSATSGFGEPNFSPLVVEVTLYSPAGAVLLTGQTQFMGDYVLRSVRLPATGVYTLAGTGAYCIVARAYATGPSFSTTGTVQLQRSGACTSAIRSLSAYPISAAGGSALLEATVSPGCSFPVTSSDWLDVTPKTVSGGTTALTAAAPAWTGADRTGEVRVGTATATVTQIGSPASGCRFGTPLILLVAPASGHTGSLQLKVSEVGCSWAASSPVPWFGWYPVQGIASTGTLAVSWTVAPNFASRFRTAYPTIAGKPFAVTQEANTLPAESRFIQLMYWSFFGRLPTQAELDFHAATGLSRRDMAWNFWRSEEFFVGGRFVGSLYLGLLNRDPEFGGWNFQRRALATGFVNADQLVSNFLGSAEYGQKFGVLSDAAFVLQMYFQVLGRTPAADEVAFHVSTLAAGLPRAALARNFLRGAESRITTSPHLTALLLYFVLLQRDPVKVDTDWIALLMAAGFDTPRLLSAVMDSPEFQTIMQ